MTEIAFEPWKPSSFYRITLWALAGCVVACVLGIVFDHRQVSGENPWLKPMRFSISFIVFLLTMVLVLRRVPIQVGSVYASVFAAVAILEVAMIGFQAARGVPSHHNVSTLFDNSIYAAMGIVVGVNTLAATALIVQLALRAKAVPLPVLVSMQLGLCSFVLGSAIGGVMSVRGAHSVGASDGGPGLPIVGWSTSAGDLRVAHFIGLHGLQVLVLVGLVAGSWTITKRREAASTVAILLLFIGWSAVTWVAFKRALEGESVRELLPWGSGASGGGGRAGGEV